MSVLNWARTRHEYWQYWDPQHRFVRRNQSAHFRFSSPIEIAIKSTTSPVPVLDCYWWKFLNTYQIIFTTINSNTSPACWNDLRIMLLFFYGSIGVVLAIARDGVCRLWPAFEMKNRFFICGSMLWDGLELIPTSQLPGSFSLLPTWCYTAVLL